MKTKTNIICPAIAIVAIGFLALLPKAQAVSPAPDGGYAGANTAEGQSALLSLTTGTYNTAVGLSSLRSNTDGSFNTAIGAGALLANIGTQNGGHGNENTATGFGALLSNTSGIGSTANGALALFSNTIGSGNTANGIQTLFSNTISSFNTANGFQALYSNVGEHNTANGASALLNNTTGSYNIALGFNAGSSVITASNVICIGAAGNNVDNSCYIGNIFNSTSSGGTAVYVNANGRLGTATSSARFKEQIKPMGRTSEALFALKPVSFRYKKEIDPAGTRQLGLVAEEVAKVNPDLVVRDQEGKPYSVRYDQVNAMLLNEFLKEHKKVDQQLVRINELNSRVAKQDIIIAQQQKGMEVLSAQIQEQALHIQKVSAQIESSKPPAATLADSQR